MSDLQVGNKIAVLNLKDERIRLIKRYGQEKNLMEFHKTESLIGKITKIDGNDCFVELGEYDTRTHEFKGYGFQRKIPIEYLMGHSKKLI